MYLGKADSWGSGGEKGCIWRQSGTRSALLVNRKPKSILMLIAANVDMVCSGDGGMTSEQCLEEIHGIFERLPEFARIPEVDHQTGD